MSEVAPKARLQITELRFWHEAVIDYILAAGSRKLTLKEIAQHFGVSPTWLSQLTRTDLFRRRYRERQEQHARIISRSMGERLQSLAAKSTDLLEKKLDFIDRLPPEAIPLKDIRETSEMALSALGYTAKGKGVQVNVTQQTALVDAETLARSRALIQKMGADAPKESTSESIEPAGRGGGLPREEPLEGAPPEAPPDQMGPALPAADLPQEEEADSPTEGGPSLREEGGWDPPPQI